MGRMNVLIRERQFRKAARLTRIDELEPLAFRGGFVDGTPDFDGVQARLVRELPHHELLVQTLGRPES